MSTHMSMSDTEHLALQDLLPWYASGSLNAAEAQRVQDHLHDCAACRQDLAWQRKLLQTEGPLPAGLDPERALARLMPQLPQQQATATAGLITRVRAWLDSWRWQGWAIAAQLAAIVVLATQLVPRGEAPFYQALGHGPAATPDVLVIFKADARLQDVQHLLQEHGAQITGGPTVTGAYMLEVESGRQAELLLALRDSPLVAQAEALTAGQP
jgi:anti-sigma-K factor RskA